MAAKSMVYYTLPDAYLPADGDEFQVFSSDTDSTFAMVGAKLLRLTTTSSASLDVTLLADFTSSLTSEQLS